MPTIRVVYPAMTPVNYSLLVGLISSQNNPAIEASFELLSNENDVTIDLESLQNPL